MPFNVTSMNKWASFFKGMYKEGSFGAVTTLATTALLTSVHGKYQNASQEQAKTSSRSSSCLESTVIALAGNMARLLGTNTSMGTTLYEGAGQLTGLALPIVTTSVVLQKFEQQNSNLLEMDPLLWISMAQALEGSLAFTAFCVIKKLAKEYANSNANSEQVTSLHKEEYNPEEKTLAAADIPSPKARM